MNKYKERVKKAKDYIGKNKVFVVFAVIIIIALIGNFLFSPAEPAFKSPPVSENAEDLEASETSENSEVVIYDNEEDASKKGEPWRFYWIDLIILIVGGGFCAVMIIKERKKSKSDI